MQPEGFWDGWIGENRVTGRAGYYKTEENARKDCDLVLPCWVPDGAETED